MEYERAHAAGIEPKVHAHLALLLDWSSPASGSDQQPQSLAQVATQGNEWIFSPDVWHRLSPTLKSAFVQG